MPRQSAQIAVDDDEDINDPRRQTSQPKGASGDQSAWETTKEYAKLVWDYICAAYAFCAQKVHESKIFRHTYNTVSVLN